MAHEITSTDQVILHKTPAWHGLGVVVQDALTPKEALVKGGFGWINEQLPLIAAGPNGEIIPITTHYANIRSDTREVLGVVTTGYVPIQNEVLAEFAEALAEQGDVVKCESVGTIRGGQKIWFLLKGESFSVRDKDEIRPYICVSNGHDGMTSMRATPTTVRVVCSNTLHQVIPRNDKFVTAGFTARHTRNIKERVEEAKAALKLYNKSLDTTKSQMELLSKKAISRKIVEDFFREVYTHDFGEIPEKPGRARNNFIEGFSAFVTRFKKEESEFGANAWTMFNAYSGFIQHDRAKKAKAETKAHSQLFGKSSDRTNHAFALALSL